MTKLADDIRRECGELRRSLSYSAGPGRTALDRAAVLLRAAREIFVTGIGSSWHAGMAVQAVFDSNGRSVRLVEAADLLHEVPLPAGSAIVALSRSGKSVEIVRLLDKAQRTGARVIGICNTPDSPLAQRADVLLPLSAGFDHNVSITMYSALTLVGGLLACVFGGTADAVVGGIDRALHDAEAALPGWERAVDGHPWLDGAATTYFIARGAHMASAYETRLLWEEAAKRGATALNTGGFRHGPQEMLEAGTRVGCWIGERLRDEDLRLLADLRSLGASTMAIGHALPADAADLVLPVPATPPGWGFLVDVIPAQLAAEALARRRGVDCDRFRICPYIIASEGGLLATAAR